MFIKVLSAFFGAALVIFGLLALIFFVNGLAFYFDGNTPANMKEFYVWRQLAMIPAGISLICAIIFFCIRVITALPRE